MFYFSWGYWAFLFVLGIGSFVFIFLFTKNSAVDKFTDFLAWGGAIVFGFTLCMGFVRPNTYQQVYDTAWFGRGYTDQPVEPTYTPKPDEASELELAPIAMGGGTLPRYKIQLTFKTNEAGKVFLPQDTKVQDIEVWTVDIAGTESEAIQVK